MSNTSQGPGWWMASDGKWYPPELWTGPPNADPAGPTAQPTDQPMAQPTIQPMQPSAQPAYPAQGPTYGAAPYGNAGSRYTPQGQSPYGQSPYGQPVHRKTNGLAIAALVCSCAGIFLLGVPAVLGIIFGFVARGQIRQSNGAQGGNGMALAGIIVGFVVVGLVILGLVVHATQHTQNNAVIGIISGLR
jgi:hypothetical protein